MTDQISLLITGNPASNSGYANIGGFGDGLKAYDPTWPGAVRGDFAVQITEDGTHTTYCLVFSPLMISSEDSNRAGVLNFQMRIPYDRAVADATGQVMSPFDFLKNFFEAYKKYHLSEFPGVKGWDFAGDGKMTEEEIREFLDPYTLVEHRLPNRHLSGSETGVIVLPVEKIKEFTLDHAYTELEKYRTIWLTTEGMTTPEELTQLPVPREPIYDIYINGVKHGSKVRKGDQPFKLTLDPPNKYQYTTSLHVDFDKALQDGIVDNVYERIDYEVEFEDREKEMVVKVELTGCDDHNTYDTLIKKLLDFTEAKCEGNPSARCERIVSKVNKKITFVTRGVNTTYQWKAVCSPLPENVKYLGMTENDEGGKTMSYRYDKPVVPVDPFKPDREQTRIDEKPGKSGEKPGKEKPTKVEIPVFIRIKGNDEKALNRMQGMGFELQLNTSPALVYENLRCTGYTELVNGLEANCYQTSISVETGYLKNLTKVEAESEDEHYKLSAQVARKKGGKASDCYILVTAEYFNKLVLMWRSGTIIAWILAVLIFAAGWFIGEYWRPFSRTAASDTENVVVEDVDVVQTDSIVSDTTHIPDDFDIDGTDDGDETVAPGTETPTAPATGLTQAERQALQSNADVYKSKLTSGNVSFAEVSAINQWLKDNAANSGPIIGYNRIKELVAAHGACIQLIREMYSTSDYEGLSNKVKNTVNGINGHNDFRNLKTKMKKLVGNGETLYNFVSAHPNGITSFSQL